MTPVMKVTALTMMTLAAALVGSTAMADRGVGMDRMMEEGMGGPPMTAADFAAIDANQDGKITEAEVETWRAARTAKIDADGDGLLSAAELAAARKDGIDARIEEQAARMIERLDTDKDGKLSAAELAGRPGAGRLFDAVDSDGDGAVTQAEIEAARERMAEGPRGDHRHGGFGGHEGRGRARN